MKAINSYLLTERYPRLIVAGWGFVAESILRNMLADKKIDLKNLYCFTYSSNDNKSFLNFLSEQEIEFTVDPISTSKSLELIQSSPPEYLISLYYRNIIPREVLALVKSRSINVHPSLLPHYKGCFSAPWAIINGEKHTGITFHEMEEEVDAGAILFQKKISITQEDTGYSLYHRLTSEIIREFGNFFDRLVAGKITSRKMPSGGSYYRREVPMKGLVNQAWEFDEIDQFIRGMFFPPHAGARVLINSEEYQINTIQEYLEKMKEKS